MNSYSGNVQELMNEMVTLGRNLALKSNEYPKLCIAFAEKERDYSMALRIEMTRLELEGTASSASEKKAKGEPSIARLGFDLAVSKGVMKACEKSMDSIKTVLNAYQSILAWERKTAEL